MKRKDPNRETDALPEMLPQGLRARLARDEAAAAHFMLLSREQQNRVVAYVQQAADGNEARTRVFEAARMLHSGEMTL